MWWYVAALDALYMLNWIQVEGTWRPFSSISHVEAAFIVPHEVRHCPAPWGAPDPLHQRKVWQMFWGVHPSTSQQSGSNWPWRRCLCGIPRPSRSHRQTSRSLWRYRQHLQMFSHVSHLPGWTQCADRAPQCWAVSSGLTGGCWVLTSSSWSLFPAVWSETSKWGLRNLEVGFKSLRG